MNRTDAREELKGCGPECRMERRGSRIWYYTVQHAASCPKDATFLSRMAARFAK